MIAPSNVFATVHNINHRDTGVSKVVAVPVVTDQASGTSGTITKWKGPLETVVKENVINFPEFPSSVGRQEVMSTFLHVIKDRKNPFTVANDDASERERRERLKVYLSKLRPIGGLGNNPQPLNVTADPEDPVEQQRNKLPCVGSVFLPDSSRIARGSGFPINFLNDKHPYVTNLPAFFPSGLEGLRDPHRVIPPSETEFVLHNLRNVRKELSENMKFVALAAYRLETRKVESCTNAFRGYNVGDSDEVEVAADFKLRYMHLPGSQDYLSKQKADITAKSETFGFPQVFYTFTCTDRWEVTLACCLSQEGLDVWHTDDEEEMLTLLPSREYPTTDGREYAVHERTLNGTACPFHENCNRVMVSDYFHGDGEKERSLLNRNVYSVNRIFDQKVKSLTRNILSPKANLKAFHDVKEFGDVSGWAHVHGVGWRQIDGTEIIFHKMHKGMILYELEKEQIINLAKTISCVSLSAERIASLFPDLSGPRAEQIVSLASRLQYHNCTSKCLSEKKPDCWQNFPHEPSSETLLASPPLVDLVGRNVKKQLVREAGKIKESVKQVLRRITARGELNITSLQTVLEQAIGDVTETIDGFSWSGGFFPITTQRFDNHCIDFWRIVLLERYDYPDRNMLNLLALYHTSLSISCSKNYELVHQRNVDEVWVAEYNPYCLEELKTNMAVKLITYTPRVVVNYITKGKGRKMGDDENSSLASVVNALKRVEKPLAERLIKRVKDMVEVCQAEALFRIDPNLSMSSTNVPITWINSSFPHRRGATYARVEEEGEELPDRVGEFMRLPRIEDRFQEKWV